VDLLYNIRGSDPDFWLNGSEVEHFLYHTKMYISIHEFHAAVSNFMRVTEPGYKKCIFQGLKKIGWDRQPVRFVFNFLTAFTF
jgi:hypothetical protein